jgi:peptide/nickel transport system permease protein
MCAHAFRREGWLAHQMGFWHPAGGQVVVEVVFSGPGLGREILNAVRTSDFPLAQASFLIMAAFVISLNLLVDILYTTLDPRVSFR